MVRIKRLVLVFLLIDLVIRKIYSFCALIFGMLHFQECGSHSTCSESQKVLTEGEIRFHGTNM